jgi:hypothetical protein
MKKLIGAFVDPSNFILVLPVIVFIIIFQILDIIGVVAPRYDYLTGVLTITYIASAVINLFQRKS